MDFVCSDEEFMQAVSACNTDGERLSVFISELYGKAVNTIHTDSVVTASDSTDERELTPSSAYLGCLMLFFRQAMELDGDARRFYSMVEGVCPYCTNIHSALIGMKLDEEVTSILRQTVFLGTQSTNMSTEALVYVARQASLVLVKAYLLDHPVACLGDSTSCGKTIEELLEDGSDLLADLTDGSSA